MPRVKDFNEFEVLNKAMNIFWRKGYASTSIQDLVEGLGIERGSLYSCYKDKRTLFKRSLQLYESKLKQKLLVSNDPVAGIKKFILDLVKECTTNSTLRGCFLINTSLELEIHDKEIQRIVRNALNQVEDFFYDSLKSSFEQGLISDQKDFRSLAQSLLSAAVSINVLSRSRPDKNLLSNIANNALDLIS